MKRWELVSDLIAAVGTLAGVCGIVWKWWITRAKTMNYEGREIVLIEAMPPTPLEIAATVSGTIFLCG